MNNGFIAAEASEDGEFERLWRQVAEGFKDVPVEELDEAIDQAVEEVRAERYRARIQKQTARSRAP